MKLPTILAALAGGGLAVLAWSQTWFELVLEAGAGGGGGSGAVIEVAGQVASPALAALGLAALALGGALAIAGRGIRIVLGVLAVLLGGCLLLATGLTLGDPVAAVGPAVTEATGIAGSASTAELVASATATFWPAVAVAGGVLVLVAGVSVLVTGLSWPASSRRFTDARRARFEGDEQAGDDAQDGSGSDSATDTGTGTGTARSTATGGSRAERPRGASDRAIDDWDELSRGDDPTD